VTDTGAHDFDFIHGSWTVHNGKLRDGADPACEEWVEPPFEGMTLRLFDPAEQTWSIFWSSTRAPGRLDPPVVGRFTDGRGVFEGDDEVGGRPVRLRFEWRADETSPRWQQELSYDGGATWYCNWVMEFTRTPSPDGREAA
jgi:hypothetical protein